MTILFYGPAQAHLIEHFKASAQKTPSIEYPSSQPSYLVLRQHGRMAAVLRVDDFLVRQNNPEVTHRIDAHLTELSVANGVNRISAIRQLTSAFYDLMNGNHSSRPLEIHLGFAQNSEEANAAIETIKSTYVGSSYGVTFCAPRLVAA
ncbi:MAG: hypothetical protein KGQ41_02480 [Alphaproteobacteria bacterium]|nr:hypothetical protein [Alphaproteobacteria bacterium]